MEQTFLIMGNIFYYKTDIGRIGIVEKDGNITNLVFEVDSYSEEYIIKETDVLKQANNKNPIPVFIPCHRVIGSSGKLVGYRGGLKVKAHLLELEKVIEEK